MRMTSGDRQARSRFQSGLLTWLRAAAPQEHANGLREMIAVTRTLAEQSASASGAPADGLLWRSAGAFLQGLLDGSLTADEESRALCRRLERHLSSQEKPPQDQRDDANTLASAIFGFVSNRLSDNGSAEHSLASGAGHAGGLDSLLGNTFSATADILPLFSTERPRRFSDDQLVRWKRSVAALRDAWHAVQTGEQESCRAAATALVELALELADAACLRIGEAFADAAGAAENPAVLCLPCFRAAFTAALEVSEHPDGPDQKGFDEIAAAVAVRMAKAASIPPGGSRLVCASAPWFAEDAGETLDELTAALDAVPPRRLALLAGFDWFIQHESAKIMAISGLAATAYKLIGQVRADDLDQSQNHAVIAATIVALRHAVDELAAGIPPKVDEDIFSALRELNSQISEQRRLAIAAAQTAKLMPTLPDQSESPLQ